VQRKIGERKLANLSFNQAHQIFDRLGAKLDVKKVAKAKRSKNSAGKIASVQLHFSEKRSKVILDYLIDAYLRDRWSKKLGEDSSGWTSLVKIARGTGLPSSTLYGTTKGGTGRVFEELFKGGLAETKFVKGERGRGGEILQLRIAHDKPEVKALIESRLLSEQVNSDQPKSLAQ